jgi:hypothetical protein
MISTWTRRQFIVRSAAGITGAALYPKGLARQPVSLRAAVIGVGERGRRHVAAGLLPNVDLSAVCDVRRDALAAAHECGRRWLKRDIQTTRRSADILDDRRIDAVVLAVPVHERPTLATEALRRGQHVYCEPPWAPDVETSSRLVEAANASGRLLYLGSQDLSWNSSVLTGLLQEHQAANSFDVAITRSTGTPLGAWSVDDWFDMIGTVADTQSGAPRALFGARVGGPAGWQQEVHVRSNGHRAPTVRLRELAGGSTRDVEWAISVRGAQRESCCWIESATDSVNRPVAEELASWHGFLAAAAADDGGTTWRREHDRAHRRLLWSTAVAGALA